MGDLDRRDANMLACILEELATSATMGVLDPTALELIGRAFRVDGEALIGDELDLIAQALRTAADTALGNHCWTDIGDTCAVWSGHGPEQHAARCRATAIAVRPFGEWCLTGGGAAF